MPSSESDYLFAVGGRAGVYVQLVNNLTGIAYISTAKTDSNGKFTLNPGPPADIYTVYVSAVLLPGLDPGWVATGDASYVVAYTAGDDAVLRSVTARSDGGHGTSGGPAGSIAAAAQIYPPAEAGGIQIVSGLLHSAGVPNNANGNNTDWCVSDNGTLYKKVAGAWTVMSAPDSTVLHTAGNETASGNKSLYTLDQGGQIFNIASARYGAISKSSANDTTNDVTSIIQQAINDARDAGGGVVWVPWSIYGWYCHGTINVWTGVTLRGNLLGGPGVGTYERVSTLGAEYQYRGSELHTDANSGTSSATNSFITIYRNAKVEGISVFYPTQDATQVTPTSFPPAMQFAPDALGKQGGGAIVDCALINPWIGISAVSHDAFLIKNVIGQPISVGIVVDTCHNTPRIDNVQFWQFWHELGLFTNLDAYILASGTSFQFLDVDGIQFSNLMSFGYHIGMVLGTSGVGGYGQGVNIDLDGCQQGIVYAEGAYPWQLSNVSIFSTSGGTTVSRCILINTGALANSGELQIDHFQFSAAGGICVEQVGGAHQAVRLSHGRFVAWSNAGGMAAYKLWGSDSDLHIDHCKFVSANSWCVDMSNLDNTATGYYDLGSNNFGRSIATAVRFGATAPPIRGLRTTNNASIAAGTSSIVVNHGLGASPRFFTGTALNDPQQRWWADTFTSTQFTLHLVANAVTNPVTIHWAAALAGDG